MVTITTTLLISLYLVLYPAHWLKHLMKLTNVSWDFKMFIIALGVAYLVAGWLGEKYIFPRVSKLIGTVKTGVTKKAKQRKEYKVIQEQMRI